VSAAPGLPPDRHGKLGSAELTDSGGLRNLALGRGEVDRSTVRRTDAEWLAAAWADPGTRVLVVEDGQALIRTAGGDDQAELVFLSPQRAPDGVRFLLGVDADGVIYFGVAGRSRGRRRGKTRAPRPGRSACGRPGRCCPTATPG